MTYEKCFSVSGARPHISGPLERGDAAISVRFFLDGRAPIGGAIRADALRPPGRGRRGSG